MYLVAITGLYAKLMITSILNRNVAKRELMPYLCMPPRRVMNFQGLKGNTQHRKDIRKYEKKNTLTPKSRKLSDSFDSDSQVDLMLDQSNKTCLAAYYVDYEDYSGMCQGKVAFPRLKAIREQLNKRTNVDEDIDLFGFQF